MNKDLPIKFATVVIVLVLITNMWLLSVNMGTLRRNQDRLDRIEMEGSPALVPKVEENKTDIELNRKEILENQKRLDEIAKELKKITDKPPGETK